MVRKQTDRVAAATPSDDPAVAGIEAFITQVTAMSRLPASRRRLRRLARIDTHESGIGILMLLSRTGPLSVTDLARHLGVNQSTASRQVVPLEEDGYLSRTVHPSHRRIQLLALSEAGAAACERAHAVGRRDIAWAIRDWPAEDRTRLSELLARFADTWAEAAIDQGLTPELPTSPAKHAEHTEHAETGRPPA